MGHHVNRSNATDVADMQTFRFLGAQSHSRSSNNSNHHSSLNDFFYTASPGSCRTSRIYLLANTIKPADISFNSTIR